MRKKKEPPMPKSPMTYYVVAWREPMRPLVLHATDSEDEANEYYAKAIDNPENAHSHVGILSRRCSMYRFGD